MSVVKSSTINAAAVAATDLPMLTPEQVTEQLRALRQQIPEFVQLANTREIRQLRKFAKVDELRALLRGVAAANLVRRHRIGLAVLQAYNVSRQLVRQDEHAHLRPHVERMTQVRKFGRRRSKPAAEPQPPVS